MLCIRCNKGAFCQGLFVAFEAMLISMYIHRYHIFNIRLKPFFLTDITFILTSVWLHFIGALRFLRRLMVTTPLREKDGILIDELTRCTLQFYGNNIRQDIHLSDWYIHLYEMDLSEKSFKYLHVSEVLSSGRVHIMVKEWREQNSTDKHEWRRVHKLRMHFKVHLMLWNLIFTSKSKCVVQELTGEEAAAMRSERGSRESTSGGIWSGTRRENTSTVWNTTSSV